MKNIRIEAKFERGAFTEGLTKVAYVAAFNNIGTIDNNDNTTQTCRDVRGSHP